jgi:hypothetical protein
VEHEDIIRAGISWTAEQSSTTHEGPGPFSQLFKIDSLQLLPSEPEYRVTSGTKPLYTSFLPPITRGMINEYVRNARNAPSPRGWGDESMSLSLLVEEKFNIVEMHSIKSIHHWRDQALALVYECESDLTMMGQRWYVLLCTMGHIACSQLTARVPIPHGGGPTNSMAPWS